MNSPFPAATAPTRARLSVEDFLLLNDHGAFDKYAKTELIEGEIWFMNAQHSRHARIKTQLAVQLTIQLRGLGSDYAPIVEASTRLTEDTLPEPDIVVTSYKGPDVVPLDSVALIIEVSDTTLAIDLGRKAALYASVGVPEYWVVDVSDNRVLIHTKPDANGPEANGSGYANQLVVPFGAQLRAVTLEGLAVETGELG